MTRRSVKTDARMVEVDACMKTTQRCSQVGLVSPAGWVRGGLKKGDAFQVCYWRARQTRCDWPAMSTRHAISMPAFVTP